MSKRLVVASLLLAALPASAAEFVMKNGIVFRRDGVMTPEKFFHAGPAKGWRTR